MEPVDDVNVRFLYVMSAYPKNTFEMKWEPLGYYVLPGAFKLWGSEERFKSTWEEVVSFVLIAMCVFHLLRLVS